MKVDKIDDIELYQEAFSIQEIGNKAVKEALKENQEKNIPSVFSKDGKLFYKLPNGEITQKSPFPSK
ncbi:MAG: hypothetical protein HOD63_05750 [Bacteroidetes bacterium]|jgi:hypothetical protein|nr:hypothetical protein [Bacteroidota bacterium]